MSEDAPFRQASNDAHVSQALFSHELSTLEKRDAHHELSQVFKKQRRLQEAKYHAQEALKYTPEAVPLLAHYASILIDLGEKESARKMLQKAKYIDEKNPDIHLALGLLWQEDEEHLLALSELHKASTLAPNSGEVHYHIARSHEVLGKTKLALMHYQSAIHMNPQHLNTYAAAAKLQMENRDYTSAQALLKLAFNQDPTHLETLLTLFEWAQFTHDYHLQTEITGALAQTIQKAYEAEVAIPCYRIKDLPIPHELKIKCFELFTHHVKTLSGQPPFSHYANLDARIKVGYVSAHLDDDEDGLLLRSILSFHNRKNFEIYLYHVGTPNKKVSEKLIRSADFYRDLSTFNDRDAANRIHADGIFYLIDLSCLRKGSRPGIFALAPAPVQMRTPSDLPFFNDPSIQLWLMPKNEAKKHPTILPYDGPSAVTLPFTQTDEVLNRVDFGLKEESFVYCYHGPMWRVDKATFSTWLALLRQAPNAVLWLTANHTLQAKHLKQYAENQNIAPDRIVLSPLEPTTLKLRHQIADVWLEPFVGEHAISYLAAKWCALPTLRLHTKQFDYDVQTKADYLDLALSFYQNNSLLDAARGALLKARFRTQSFRPDIYIDALEAPLQKLNLSLLRGEG